MKRSRHTFQYIHGLVYIYGNIMTSHNSTTMLIVGCGLNLIIFFNFKKIIMSICNTLKHFSFLFTWLPSQALCHLNCNICVHSHTIKRYVGGQIQLYGNKNRAIHVCTWRLLQWDPNISSHKAIQVQGKR